MSNQEKLEAIAILSEDLFYSLPFWKKWNVAKWYRKNNWDVTHEWEQCVKQAWRMVEEREYILKPLTPTPITKDNLK